MSNSLIAIIALAAVTVAAPALAHHGWGSYDASRTLTLDGRIEGVSPDNPHAELKLRADGKLWRVTLSPPGRMSSRGKPITDIKVGDRVVAIGYPSRVNQDEIRAERIIHNDFTVELR
jgi:hypothetical protein